MAFDDDLWQPHVENRAAYRKKVKELEAEGFTVMSPVLRLWRMGRILSTLEKMNTPEQVVTFIIVNSFEDVQFFFKGEGNYSLFLLQFTDNIREDLGYVK